MASLWKHPESKYWVACYTTADGQQRKKSTKIEAKEKNRSSAQGIADDLESAHKKRLTAEQIFKLYSETRREVAGESIPATTVREFFTGHLERIKREVSPATIAAYKGASKKFLAWLGNEADEEIHRVSRQHIRRFRDMVGTEIVEEADGTHAARIHGGGTAHRAERVGRHGMGFNGQIRTLHGAAAW
ncbi:MAG: hypothetical protein NTY98_06290 [Verrucomicrobia bacterium]|nr:hypothetical protein [Verrucomicrobiota bacterium]